MKQSLRHYLKNTLYTLVILIVFFMIGIIIHNYFTTDALVPTVFILAVFLVTLVTDGYFYGVCASILSVIIVNYAFTFPYFEINFLLRENAVFAIVMMIVTVVLSMLITKIKRQDTFRMEHEKEKMRANLLRAISHDLRTPLTAIFGASSTILDNFESLPNGDMLLLIRGIKEDAHWLIRMVENLLSVTRIDDKNVRLVKTSTVLFELIDSVIAKFKKRYPNQTVLLSMPDEFITIAVDALLIEQVLMNFLENAMEHAEGMTRLHLNVKVTKSEVTFEVIDNGCGISKDRLKNIFSGRFPSDNSHADTNKQSMGIGLSVCATIIKAHGGTIWAKNRDEGGITFAFALDREAVADEQ